MDHHPISRISNEDSCVSTNWSSIELQGDARKAILVSKWTSMELQADDGKAIPALQNGIGRAGRNKLGLSSADFSYILSGKLRLFFLVALIEIVGKPFEVFKIIFVFSH